MIGTENICVGCPQGCINCGRKHALVCTCDRCGEQIDPGKLYEYDGEDYCIDCLKMVMPTVKDRL